MSEPKYAYRLPPCPDYDLEGMESWLEAMAKKGLILSTEGSFAGFTIFEKQAPRDIRYRLQPFSKQETLFSAGGPEPAAVELAEEYGWRLVTTRGMYAVYCTDDPNTPELDTDPLVQAMTIDQRIKRCRRSLIVDILLALLVIGLLVWMGPLTFFLESPLWYSLALAAIWIVAFALSGAEMKQLKALRTKLLSGQSLSREKNWSSRRWLHRIGMLASALLLTCFWIAVLLNNFLGWEQGRWQSAENLSLPFAHMADLSGGGEFEPSGMADRPYHAAERTTLLAASQIKFEQWGDMTENGKVLVGGSLEVSYVELRWEWLAKALYNELLRDGQRHKYYDGLDALPDLGVDQAAAYMNYFPVLLLRDGNRVLYVDFAQYGADEKLPLAEWAAVMAETFLA